jgi:hypothetical protein
MLRSECVVADAPAATHLGHIGVNAPVAEHD